MKRLALLALLMTLVGATPANAIWPCWMVRGYAVSKGLGPPVTPEKQRRIAALIREYQVSAEDQEKYRACFTDTTNEQQAKQGAKAQGPKAQKRGRKGRGHR